MDREQLAAALERINANSNCPACAANMWNPGELDIALTSMEDDAVRPVICGRCGFVKLHHLPTLIRTMLG